MLDIRAYSSRQDERHAVGVATGMVIGTVEGIVHGIRALPGMFEKIDLEGLLPDVISACKDSPRSSDRTLARRILKSSEYFYG